MSRGLSDPGLNPSMSDFMRELNEEADRKQKFIFDVGNGVSNSIKQDREKSSRRRIEEAKAAAERKERERMKKETGFDSVTRDAFTELARSLPTSEPNYIL